MASTRSTWSRRWCWSCSRPESSEPFFIPRRNDPRRARSGREQLDLSVVEVGEGDQLLDAVHHRGRAQVVDAVGTEPLDVEGRQRCPVGHRIAQYRARYPGLELARDVAHETAGARVPGPGRVNHGVQREGWKRKELVGGDQS